MKIARVALVALGLALGLATAACPGPTLIVQQYAGPVRPEETIAILRVDGRESVQLLTLDDEDVAVPVAEDSRLHIEVLPAGHVLVVTDERDPFHRGETVAFRAEAGRVYRVIAGADMPPRIWEVDRTTNGPVRDVTLERNPPSPSVPDAG